VTAAGRAQKKTGGLRALRFLPQCASDASTTGISPAEKMTILSTEMDSSQEISGGLKAGKVIFLVTCEQRQCLADLSSRGGGKREK